MTEDFNANAESEGSVLIVGDVAGRTINVNDNGNIAHSDGFADLIVTGTVTNSNLNVGSSGDVANGGDLTNSTLQLNGGVQTVTLGGTRSGGSFNQNEDILIQNGAPLLPMVDFDALEQESLDLATLTGSALDVSDRNQISFGGNAVLNTRLADLSASGTASFDLTGIDTLLINVSGQTGSYGLNGFDKIAAERIIWNFYEATDLTLATTISGNVFAPFATVNVGGSTEGNIVAATVIADGGEVHPSAWLGNVPSIVTTAPVPLPAGLVFLMTGLMGFAALGRRRT